MQNVYGLFLSEYAREVLLSNEIKKETLFFDEQIELSKYTEDYTKLASMIKRQADAVWTYKYKEQSEGLTILERIHYSPVMEKTMLDDSLCFSRGLDEYFWNRIIPLYKQMDCPN